MYKGPVLTILALACSSLARPNSTLQKRVTFTINYAPETSPDQPRDVVLESFEEVRVGYPS
jgi:hypothetical protein